VQKARPIRVFTVQDWGLQSSGVPPDFFAACENHAEPLLDNGS
jgi:hypothetical protein